MSLRDDVIKLCDEYIASRSSTGSWIVKFKRLCEDTPDDDPFWLNTGPDSFTDLLERISEISKRKLKEREEIHGRSNGAR